MSHTRTIRRIMSNHINPRRMRDGHVGPKRTTGMDSKLSKAQRLVVRGSRKANRCKK